LQGVNPREVISWINEIEKIPSGSCECPPFLKPLHLVTIGLAAKRSGWKGLKLPRQLEQYASRMHLWESVNLEPPVQVNHHSQTGKFLPVQRFDQHQRDAQAVAADLANIIDRTLTDEYRSSLSACLGELVNNFFDHSHSSPELPCLIAAQSWPQGKLVQVAIADAGIGIRNSLSESPDLSEKLKIENACTLASAYGISSKLGKGHSGYGLTLAKDLMKQVNGSYILVSGNEIYSSTRGHGGAQKLSSTWNGTVLVLEWSLDSQLNSKAVYDSWPYPKGFDKNDFF